MEFACRGQPAAAAADHGFPHLQLPHGHGDLEAARRREELTWELHLERMRQDIILRELAEAQRAMAARFTPPGNWHLQAIPPPQGYWHHCGPPSLPSYGAAPHPPLPVTEYSPYTDWGPVAARPPPMYPHVEQPVPPPPPADCGNSTLPEGGALVPYAANAGAGTMMSVASAEEVTPGDRSAVGGEPKHDVEDGHRVQLFYPSENQSGERSETAECAVKDQSNELVARPCQDDPASQENGTSDEQKRLAFTEAKQTSLMDAYQPLSNKLNLPEGSLVPAAANSGAETTILGERLAAGREPKHGVENGHNVQQFYQSENQSGEQRETTESTMKDQTGEIVSRRCIYDEQKRLAFIEPTPQTEGLKRKLSTTISPVTTKKSRNKSATATPGAPPLLRNSNGSVAQNGACGVNAPRPAHREPAPSRKWTCLVCDTTCNSKPNFHDHLGGSKHHQNTKTILAKFKSSYDRRKDDGPVKTVYYCKACDVCCTGDTALASHLVGRKHRRKTHEGRERDAGTGSPESMMCYSAGNYRRCV